jgi:hypothetical protein
MIVAENVVTNKTFVVAPCVGSKNGFETFSLTKQWRQDELYKRHDSTPEP